MEKAPLDLHKAKHGAYDALQETTATRWSKAEQQRVTQPSIIRKDNTGMGGVDLFDPGLAGQYPAG